MTRQLDFSTWTAALAARGFTVLSPSHAVPVQLWLRTGDDVLHLSAQGTRVVLRRHAATDLTSLILRAACDCEEHRTAGASSRTVLAPGAQPLDEAVLDGAALFGWSSWEAGLLDVPTAAGILESLLARLGVVPVVPAVSEVSEGRPLGEERPSDVLTNEATPA
jgi:hypothetical protein